MVEEKETKNEEKIPKKDLETSEEKKEKIEKKIVKKKEKVLIDKIKENPWIVSTIALGILALLFIFIPFNSNSGNCNSAGQKFVDYINNEGQFGTITFISADDFGSGLCKVEVGTENGNTSVYVTKDGGYLVQVALKLEEENTNPEENNVEIPKSDKPLVELFVMSYCPYGTQAEKGIIPAIEALGDKINFKLRFVDYAMHPTSGEVNENLLQYCIQKEAPDKLLPYLKCFLDSGENETCLTNVELNDGSLDECISSTDSEYNVIGYLNDKDNWISGRYVEFDIDKVLNEEYGVGGSPTLVINGLRFGDERSCSPSQQKAGQCIIYNVGRNPASYLDVICKAFNNKPEECNTSLSSTSYSPGFGYENSGNSGSGGTCG